MYQETSALDKERLYNVLTIENGCVFLTENIMTREQKKGVIKCKNTKTAAHVINGTILR